MPYTKTIQCKVCSHSQCPQNLDVMTYSLMSYNVIYDYTVTQ